MIFELSPKPLDELRITGEETPKRGMSVKNKAAARMFNATNKVVMNVIPENPSAGGTQSPYDLQKINKV